MQIACMNIAVSDMTVQKNVTQFCTLRGQSVADTCVGWSIARNHTDFSDREYLENRKYSPQDIKYLCEKHRQYRR